MSPRVRRVPEDRCISLSEGRKGAGVLVGSGLIFFVLRLLCPGAGLETEAIDAMDCDRLLLSTVDEAVLPARLRPVSRDSAAFWGAIPCFFVLLFGFGALLLDFDTGPGVSTSLNGLTSRGGSGLGTRRPAMVDRFRFHGVELPGACERKRAPFLCCTGVVPADAGWTYGG